MSLHINSKLKNEKHFTVWKSVVEYCLFIGLGPGNHKKEYCSENKLQHFSCPVVFCFCFTLNSPKAKAVNKILNESAQTTWFSFVPWLRVGTRQAVAGEVAVCGAELCGTTTNNNKETGSLLTLKVGCGVGRVKYIFPHIAWTRFYFFWWEETKITFLKKFCEFIWFLDSWTGCLHSL